MAFVYLASPYSHVAKHVMRERYIAAQAATAWLLARRIWTYSPIVHCHALAERYSLPTGADFWGEFSRAMLERSDELYILMLAGWRDSAGVRDEAGYANRLDLPIKFMLPTDNINEPYTII